MVQLMSTKKSSVKVEVEESLEDQLGPIHKRSKLDSSLQMIPVASLCNPLDEPSPLGLRLKKSPSFWI
ncbi:hypothetical protein P3X46_033883 [Hevea brasiliensis]|uniref:Uncharacterized protein n=1 Tax=Hevea brasiliensis TaxID=3981 RepID=A0ABQ9K9D6_HEVBR|nr:hypothetical protein P3X46_033883 [Hevea brasiliensis]